MTTQTRSVFRDSLDTVPEQSPLDPKFVKLMKLLADPGQDGMAYDNIPLRFINLGNNVRKRIDMDSPGMIALMESLQVDGLINPITIVAQDGAPTLKAGFRRYRAMEALGWETTRVTLKTNPDHQGDVLQAIENVIREDLDALDFCDALKIIKTHGGLSNDRVAERVGLKDRGLVGYYLKAADWPQSAKDKFRAAGLTRVHIYRICRHVESNDAGKLEEMIQQIKEPHRQGASVDPDVKGKIAAIMKKHSLGKERRGTFRKAAASYYAMDEAERKAFKAFMKSI